MSSRRRARSLSLANSSLGAAAVGAAAVGAASVLGAAVAGVAAEAAAAEAVAAAIQWAVAAIAKSIPPQNSTIKAPATSLGGWGDFASCVHPNRENEV